MNRLLLWLLRRSRRRQERRIAEAPPYARISVAVNAAEMIREIDQTIAKLEELDRRGRRGRR